MKYRREFVILFSLALRFNRYMLMTIAVILFVLWLLGVLTSYTLGGFIYVLLVLAIVMFLIRIIQGRNPVQ